jgi:hypothetical protein
MQGALDLGFYRLIFLLLQNKFCEYLNRIANLTYFLELYCIHAAKHHTYPSHPSSNRGS